MHIPPLRDGSVIQRVRTLTAVVSQDDDLVVAACPDVSTVSQGFTIGKAVGNAAPVADLGEFSLEKTGRWITTTFEAPAPADAEGDLGRVSVLNGYPFTLRTGGVRRWGSGTS